MANICTIQKCNGKHLAKGYCPKHYYRLKRGQSLTGKSRYDRRPARVDGARAYITLGSGKGEALVNADLVNLDTHNWCLSGDGYPMTCIDGKFVKIHHLVLGKPAEGFVTDHINRDKLDNRRENLRFVTQRDNLLNSTISLRWQTA